MIRTVIRLAVLALVVAVLTAACNTSESPFMPSSSNRSLSVQDFVVSASIDGSPGGLGGGFAPSPSGGPVILDVIGNQFIVNGGTSMMTVTSVSAFSKLYLSIAGASFGIGNESEADPGGFFDVSLPAAATSASLLLAFPQEIPTSKFDLFFAVEDTNGAVGSFSSVTFDVIQVGTGDVQVTLSWDVDSDVDLHVVDPSGEELYFGNRESASGGMLDRDSNPECAIDGIRNENIFWPVGAAPQGTYVVRVNHWAGCDLPRTNWTVLINNGGDVPVVTGSFTGPGVGGGLGSGEEVARFELTTGPAPSSFSSSRQSNSVNEK